MGGYGEQKKGRHGGRGEEDVQRGHADEQKRDPDAHTLYLKLHGAYSADVENGAEKSHLGSEYSPFTMRSRCRCAPVETPVEPT